jgi:hypothetical protein
MTLRLIEAPPRLRAHLYAIVRVELDAGDETPWEHRITVKEIVADADQADAEVRRLNELNRDKKCYYFSTITRLKGYTIEVEEPHGLGAGSAAGAQPAQDAP